MSGFPERPARERETLVFPDAEGAQGFRERVHEQVREQPNGVRRDKEIVAQELANQFALHGEEVAMIRQPWEHTPQEHEEAQQLMDVAFEHDLGVALSQAKKSQHYPRNIDLLHDLLTGEMYEHVKQSGINKEPLTLWITEVVIIVLVALLAVLFLLLTLSS